MISVGADVGTVRISRFRQGMTGRLNVVRYEFLVDGSGDARKLDRLPINGTLLRYRAESGSSSWSIKLYEHFGTDVLDGRLTTISGSPKTGDLYVDVDGTHSQPIVTMGWHTFEFDGDTSGDGWCEIYWMPGYDGWLTHTGWDR